MEGTQPLYKRVLIKLSGEALSAGQDGILNYTFLEKICAVIKRCVDMGVEVSSCRGRREYLARKTRDRDGQDTG